MSNGGAGAPASALDWTRVPLEPGPERVSGSGAQQLIRSPFSPARGDANRKTPLQDEGTDAAFVENKGGGRYSRWFAGVDHVAQIDERLPWVAPSSVPVGTTSTSLPTPVDKASQQPVPV
jgi:hypothetical protein